MSNFTKAYSLGDGEPPTGASEEDVRRLELLTRAVAEADTSRPLGEAMQPWQRPSTTRTPVTLILSEETIAHLLQLAELTNIPPSNLAEAHLSRTVDEALMRRARHMDSLLPENQARVTHHLTDGSPTWE